jgi:ferredoxin
MSLSIASPASAVRPSIACLSRRRPVGRSSRSQMRVEAASVKVTITPSDGGESITTTVDTASVLRAVILDTGAQLYGGMDRLMNCGGMGNCGTCLVDVVEGADLLSEQTEAELRKVKAGKLKEGWRMSCQCLVGGDAAPEGAELSVVVRPKK